MGLTIELADAGPLDASGIAALRADLARLAPVIAARFDASGEVRARVVGDEEMARLHEQYANEPGTTDVLTFDLREGESGPLDTDVVVCLDEARRQVEGRGHEPGRELLLYILHGVLHCLGFDDHTDEGFARMHAAEDELLTAAGVGPLFDRPTSQDS